MLTVPNPVRQGTPTSIRLDSVGDGSGFINFNGDYSAVPVVAKRAFTARQKYAFNRIQITLGSTNNIALNGYGGGAAGLTNGLVFSGQIQGAPFTSTVPPIRTNAELSVSSTQTVLQSLGGNDRIFTSYQAFPEFGDGPIYLDGSKGDFIQFALSDNFSVLSLSYHRFTVFGYFF